MKKTSLSLMVLVLLFSVLLSFTGCNKTDTTPPTTPPDDGDEVETTVKNPNEEAEDVHVHTCTWSMIDAPTCLEKGTKSGVCSGCGETVSGYTVPLGHTYENGTCTACNAVRPTPSEGLEFQKISGNYGTGYAVTGIGTCKDENLVIPWEHEGLPVLVIDEEALAELDHDLKSIYIPGSVCEIAAGALAENKHLTDVTLENGLLEIGIAAFAYCTSLQSIFLPNSLQIINGGAFQDADIQEIIIPKNVSDIGTTVFENNTALSAIYVDPENRFYHSNQNCLIETSNRYLVAGCKNSIIPDDGTVTHISYKAFAGCLGLETMNIPATVKTIFTEAFAGCKNLVQISGMQGVTQLNSYAFADCEKLAQITLPEGLEQMGRKVFYSCNALKELHIPASLTSIRKTENWSSGNYEQHNSIIGAPNLISLTVDPNNSVYHSKDNCLIETAKKELIAGCSTSVIPADGSVTSIGYQAFGGTDITSVSIPDGVVNISSRAFEYCSKLASITLPRGITNIGYNAFYQTAYYNQNIWKAEDDILYIGEYLIASNYSGSELTIKDGTVLIAGSALQYGSGTLQKINIPESVKYFGDCTFSNFSKLTEIKIPYGTTTVSEWMFMGCRNLKTITLPNSIKLIEEAAFYNAGVETIHFLGSKAEWNEIENVDGWYDLKNCTIHCTDGDIVLE